MDKLFNLTLNWACHISVMQGFKSEVPFGVYAFRNRWDLKNWNKRNQSIPRKTHSKTHIWLTGFTQPEWRMLGFMMGVTD